MEILIYVIGIILAVVGAAAVGLEGPEANWYWYAVFVVGLILALGVSEIVKREKMKRRKKFLKRRDNGSRIT